MWTELFFFAHMALALGVVLRVLVRPQIEPPVRLAWIMVIEALPLLGVAAYLMFGEVRMRRAEVQKMADIRDRLSGLKQPSPAVVTEPSRQSRPVVDAARAVGGMDAVGGNAIALLPEGNAAIDDLVAAIDGATRHVHVLFYIWLADGSGGKVADAIGRAARRGVDCRVIVDALGSRQFVRSAHWGAMKAAGADCVTAFPWGMPFISMLFQRLDLRNHRKIVVIDNAVAFTGSRNCADMEFAVKARYGPWVDILVAVRGPAVRQFQSVFLGDWMTYTGRDLGDDMLAMVDPVAAPGVVGQVISTGPDLRAGSMSDCMATMIYAARDSVTITTPYYVPDMALDSAIRGAARRGVDVTLVLPERNDSLVVGATSQGFYHALLAAGVRIRLFQGGLLHSKIMTVDGRMAMIGSANMDRRSFELNYEVNMAIYDHAVCAALDARVASYLDRARSVGMAEVRGWSRLRRIRNNMLALATPLL